MKFVIFSCIHQKIQDNEGNARNDPDTAPAPATPSPAKAAAETSAPATAPTSSQAAPQTPAQATTTQITTPIVDTNVTPAKRRLHKY